MLLLTAFAALAEAQTADLAWRTIRTEHFRVHYPEVAAPWAEQAAARLEAWHARVMAEVGWTPPKVIDAVVVDPFSDANGLAMPWTGAPRTMWFATPPEASSSIGHYRGWDEILLVHEDTHLVHLLRESRNPALRALEQLVGFGPVASSPRWVTEGYATVVEGRLTGFGRPNGDGRAVLLRRLAQRGELPSYGELDANARWGGGGYAYLVGSAFLEWLERRAGPGSLRNLWARMSARQVRSFDEAFVGVFGETPAVLYGRFCAEVTASAILAEQDEPADTRPFEELGWTVGFPDVSPDGTKVAVPRFPKVGVPRIEVWSLAEDADAAKKRDEAQAKVLEKDPVDVAPVPPKHAPHERLENRVSEGFAARELHWTGDGTAIVFSAWTRDRDGRLRPDLYRWTIDGKRSERLTVLADLRAPDPAPDGTWIAAVHNDWGQTQIVRVDPATGSWTGLTPLSLVQVDFPRVSPDGSHLAWLENSGAGFGVVVQDLVSGDRWTTSPGAGGLTFYSLAWGTDGALLATAGLDGFVEVHEVWKAGGRGRGRLTATAGTAFAADPVDGARALYLSMSSAGLDLAEAPLAPRGPEPAAGEAPIRRPPLPEAPPFPPADPVDPQPYGLGPTDVSLFAGAAVAVASQQGQFEVAARLGDPVGRSELLLIGGVAMPRGGSEGLRAEWTLRALPVRLGVDLYGVGDDAYATRRVGFALEGQKRLDGPWWSLGWRSAAAIEGVLPGDLEGPRQLVYTAVSFGASEPSQRWVGGRLTLKGTGGRLDETAYGQGELSATARFFREAPLALSYDLGVASGDGLLDRFSLGGGPSSLSYDPGELWHVEDPAFRADIARGRFHEYAEVALDTPLGLYIGRHRIGDAFAELDGFTAAGVRAGVDVPEWPFFRVPAVSTQAGAACRLEYPGLGFDDTPCRQLSDYTFWLNVTFGR